MKIVPSLRLLCAALLLLPTLAPAAPAPAPEALALIKELGLREASTPASAIPGWQPQRVVVLLPAFITRQIPGYEEQLKAAAGPVELVFDREGKMAADAEMLAGADAVIGLCSQQLLQNAGPELRWLHSYRVGMDSCTGLSAQQQEQVTFSNNKRLSGPAIAEHAVAMLLSLTRGLHAYSGAQAESRWDRALASQVSFGELQGKTMLVVGLGGIGTQIALRAHGLGMRVIATRNSSRSGPDYVDYVGLADELPKLSAEADVIVNALPLTSATRGLFDKAFFEGVKPGSIFISVGRGQSTVTADLVQALESGQLFGAGLDVVDPEPLPPESPLWQMSNVIITPHVSAAGADSMRRTAIISVENLRRYVAGEPLLNIVNIGAGY
jgi:phosphoglycerate dehydrogenase-like enzyme